MTSRELARETASPATAHAARVSHAAAPRLAPASVPARVPGGRLSPANVLQLQRTVGNAAVGGLLAPPLRAAPAVTPGTAIQRKANIGGIEVETLAQLAEQADDETWNAPEALDKEIAERLLATDYEYDSVDQFLREVQMRKALIEGLEMVEADDNLAYNHEGDNLSLPPKEWRTVKAYDEKGKPAASRNESGGAAFQSRNTAAAAIDAIFGDKTEEFFLECNTAAVAIHYRALKEVLGTDAFNAMFSKGITLMPEWLTTGADGGDAPSKALIPETEKTVESVDDLVPGDWVYFVNFPDYDVKHPTGPFTGENALYMGGGKFRGFGVEAMSHGKMNMFLMAQYNEGLAKKDQKTERADSDDTLDGKVPGIMKGQIRRMAENPAIRKALE